MTFPKAVVFDLGKVLLDFDYGIAIGRIQKQCRLSRLELNRLIDQSPLLHRYETNLLSTAQFFAEVRNASGLSASLEEFREMFADIFTAIDPMVQLHADLRAQGTPTYIFSNTNEIAVHHIRARFPFFHQFDGYVLSYEHDVMKPDPALYEVVERATKACGPDLLYIDDRPENIAVGRARGWSTILHETPTATRAGVAATGLLSKQA